MKDLNEEIVHALFQTVGVLADMANLHEPKALSHQTKTSRIARTLAQMMGLREDEIDCIRMAATLHDLGHLLIPADILNKPEALSAEEYEIVKGHPQAAYDLIRDIEFPWPVPEIVLQHHERLDGSGYPKGLKGDEILLEAQIIAIADAMEAMTSPRPWRAAMTPEQALAEVIKDKETKYERDIVNTCVDLYTREAYRLDPEYYGRGE
ncbi:MAG: HD domain-containing protein [Alphaproteobacteria bacterium]|nr:HD domain-containing protein [Alphaproteobacteria bacterium]